MNMPTPTEMNLVPVYHKRKKSSIYAIDEGDIVDIKLQEGGWLRAIFIKRNSAAGCITVQTTRAVRVVMVGWIEKINLLLTVSEGSRN